MARALGLKPEGGNAFLKTLSGKKPGSEIGENLREKLENPIVFNVTGADPGHGFEAEVLVEIPCYVLEDGKRIIHQRGMVSALGMSRGGSSPGGGDRLKPPLHFDDLKRPRRRFGR